MCLVEGDTGCHDQRFSPHVVFVSCLHQNTATEQDGNLPFCSAVFSELFWQVFLSVSAVISPFGFSGDLALTEFAFSAVITGSWSALFVSLATFWLLWFPLDSPLFFDGLSTLPMEHPIATSLDSSCLVLTSDGHCEQFHCFQRKNFFHEC